MVENQLDNTQEIISVSEINKRAKSILEENFPFVWIQGEVSNFFSAASGHWYFSLKDETSLINATIWKWSSANIGLMPEEGLEVICSGKLTTYPGRSSYQINISKIEHAGEGALLKQLEERKKKFFFCKTSYRRFCIAKKNMERINEYQIWQY